LGEWSDLMLTRRR